MGHFLTLSQQRFSFLILRIFSCVNTIFEWGVFSNKLSYDPEVHCKCIFLKDGARFPKSKLIFLVFVKVADDIIQNEIVEPFLFTLINLFLKCFNSVFSMIKECSRIFEVWAAILSDCLRTQRSLRKLNMIPTFQLLFNVIFLWMSLPWKSGSTKWGSQGGLFTIILLIISKLGSQKMLSMPVNFFRQGQKPENCYLHFVRSAFFRNLGILRNSAGNVTRREEIAAKREK